MFRTFIIIVSSFIAGAFVAIGILLLLPVLTLPVNNQLYQIFGIRKNYIIGFQPYWLLEKADKQYNQHITTLTYFGLALDTDGTVQKLANKQEEESGWFTLKSKKLHDKLQTVSSTSLLIHNADEASISALMKNPEKHADNLITDISPLMKKYGFTDLNIDIESFQIASDSSRQQFTRFLKETKKEIDQNKLGTLTVEISPTAFVKKYLINPLELGQIADYVVIMAYDYHYSGSYVSGPVAPVGGVGKTLEFDVATGIKEATKVIPAKKIILGIPLYGYEWETLENKPGAAIIPHTSATASNRRMEKLLSTCKNCTKTFDETFGETRVVFPDEQVNDYHQIWYEDQQGLKQKIALANTYHLAGVALWALGYEGNDMLSPLEQYKGNVEWTK